MSTARHIRLYGRVNSIAVQKVLWTAAHLQITKDLERVDAGGKFGLCLLVAPRNASSPLLTYTIFLILGFPPNYETLNPNKKVPTFVHEKFTLFESHAICKYMVRKFGTLPEHLALYPQDDLKTMAKIDCWLDWKSATLYPDIQNIFFTMIRTPPEKRDLKAFEKSKNEANR